jgi:hypothetical protein
LIQLRLRSRLLPAAALLASATALFWSTGALAQGSTATVSLTAPSKAAPDGAEIDVLVNVKDVKNIGGFQFILTVDSGVLQPVSVAKGEFLGSSGREVYCPEPTIDSSSVLLKCVTLRPEPAGADGSGLLATVKFKPLAAGNTSLALSHVRLLEPDGTEIESKSEDSSLKVAKGGSSSKTLWLIVGGVAVVAILVVAGGSTFAMRQRGGAPAA